MREQFLASLDPKVLLSIEQLNERLWHWLDTVYHRREHSSLQTTPLLRWQRDIEQVRQLPPATDLGRLFFHRVDRLVRRDSTFLLQNRFFEAPSHLAGKRIEVRFDPLDLTQLEIFTRRASRKVSRGWSTRSSMGCCRPGRRSSGNHVGILLRLQENSLLRQPRRQTTVRLPGLEPSQNAAGVPGPTFWRRSGHRRSRRR